MVGVYRDKKSGRWYYSIGSGKSRRRKSLGPNERLARLRAAEMSAHLEREQAGFPEAADKSLTIKGIFDRYLESVRVNGAPRTVRRYEAHAGHLLEFMDRHRIDKPADVDAHLVEQFKGWRAGQGAKSATVNKDLIFLKSAWLYALGTHPFRRVRPLKVRDQKTIRFLTEAEAAHLIEAADEEFRPFLVAYLTTGARKEELTALTWDDVDFDRRRVRLTNLKTYRSAKDKHRYVPMHSDLEQVLLDRRDLPKPFTPPGSVNTLRRRLIATAKAAGLSDLTRLHDLRHTWASWMAKAGMPEALLATMLGHSKNSTATRIYIHFMPEDATPYVGRIKIG